MQPIEFETRTLTQLQETLYVPDPFLSNLVAVEGDSFVTEYVEVQYMKGSRKLAPYVSELLPGKVITRTGFEVEFYKPAMLQPARTITSIDLVRAGYGENVYSQKTPQQRADEMMARDMMELTDTLKRRKEEMIRGALFFGEVTQIGDGVKQKLDYKFTNKVVNLPADYWTNTNADTPVNPFAQMAAEAQKAQRSTGKKITRVLMAPDAAEAFINNPYVQEILDLRNFSIGTVAPERRLENANYIGTFNYPGFTFDVWSYNEVYLEDFNEDGTQKLVPEVKELIPSGTIVLMPDGPLFRIDYGAVTIANPAGDGFITYAQPVVPESWMVRKPAQRWLQLNSKPLPIPINVDAWVVMQVIAPSPVDQGAL